MSKRRVSVAYEDPSVGRREAAYRKRVRDLLDRMGAPNSGELIHNSSAYLDGALRGGLTPEVSAGMIWHKHCSPPSSVPCVAEGAPAAEGAEECPCDGKPEAVAVVGVSAEAAEDKMEHGLRVQYLAANQAYALMWHGSVLRIFLTKKEALEEKTRLLAGMTAEARDSAPACVPFTKLERDPEALAACRAFGKVNTDADVYRILLPYLGKQDQEVIVLVSIDLNRNVRAFTEIARGQRDRVQVDVADVVRAAAAAGPHAVILAHNHPSGNAMPSDSDRVLTEQVRTALAAANLMLADHVVVGDGAWYSFADDTLKFADRHKACCPRPVPKPWPF